MMTQSRHFRHFRSWRDSIGRYIPEGIACGLRSIIVGLVANVPLGVAIWMLSQIPDNQQLYGAGFIVLPVFFIWLLFGVVCLVWQAVLAAGILKAHRQFPRVSSDQKIGAWGLWSLGVFIVFAPVIPMVAPR